MDLAREYYGNKKFNQKDVRPMKLVDFEGIAQYHSENIILLVYGKIQHKNELPTINMGLLGGDCFYIKKTNVLCKQWECKHCRQIFTRDENLIRHLKEVRCTGGKTKFIFSGGKYKHILNSSEKVFCGSNTKFSYTAFQWIEAEAMEADKHIHHKMCGHGGEAMVNVWVSNDKGKKHQ